MLPHLVALRGLARGIYQNDRAAHAHARHDDMAAIKVVDQLGLGAGLGWCLGTVPATQLRLAKNRIVAREMNVTRALPPWESFPM